jgi:hypothetical protein
MIKICLATIINIMQRQEKGGGEKDGKKISYLLRQGVQKCESVVGRTTNVLFNIQNFFFLSVIYNPLVGFSRLILEVPRSHTMTQHSQ